MYTYACNNAIICADTLLQYLLKKKDEPLDESMPDMAAARKAIRKAIKELGESGRERNTKNRRRQRQSEAVAGEPVGPGWSNPRHNLPHRLIAVKSNVFKGIGQRVRLARERACMTQRELAEDSRISVKSLSAIERGLSVHVDAQILRRIAIATRVSSDFLLGIEKKGLRYGS